MQWPCASGLERFHAMWKNCVCPVMVSWERESIVRIEGLTEDHPNSAHSSSGLPGRDICFSSKGLLHTNPSDDISANPSSMFHRRSLLQGEGTLAPHTGPRSLATLTWFHGFPGGRCSSEDKPHPLLLQQEILMNFDVPMVTTLGGSGWWR